MNLLNVNTQCLKWLCAGVMLLLTLAAVCMPVTDSWADQITTIRFKERVEIDSAEILLGQIASFEGDDVHFIQQLKNILIGKAPLPGESRPFDLTFLQKRLKQHHVDMATVVVDGPPKIAVICSHVDIQKQEIEKIVSDFILRQAPGRNQTMRIKDIRVKNGVMLPKGRITYKVSAPRSRQLMGRCPIAVDFSVNGHFHKKVWATAMIEVLGPVVVTRKPLGRYKPIAADDIEVQMLDLATVSANVLCDPDAAIGKRTKRVIGAQTPLRADSVELPPLVKRGDRVTIIAESQCLKITTLGQVKKKGRKGERIPVINLDSKKILHAVVVDANTVKVDF